MTPADATAHLVIASTPAIRIRRKTRADAANDYRWRQDEELQRFNGELVRDATFAEFLSQFEIDLIFGHERRGIFAIETHEGEQIGNVMFYNADRRTGATEFGISIASPGHRDRGIGRQVTIAFLRYLWDQTPYRRVVLHTLEWNVRAQRSFAAAGFEPIGRVFRNGEPYIRMEALREWWLMRDAEGRYAWPPPRETSST